MTKRYDSDAARIAVAGWAPTLRYALLCWAVAPATQVSKWATAAACVATSHLLLILPF